MTFEMTWNGALERKFKTMLLNAIVSYTNSGSYVWKARRFHFFRNEFLIPSSTCYFSRHETVLSSRIFVVNASYILPAKAVNFLRLLSSRRFLASLWKELSKFIARTVDHNRDSFSLLTANVMENIEILWHVCSDVPIVTVMCKHCYRFPGWDSHFHSSCLFIYVFHYTWVLKVILNFISHDYVYCRITWLIN